MSRRSIIFIPAPDLRWETWSCRAATTLVQQETTAHPVLPGKTTGKLIVALPAQACRTFALRIPSRDPKTARQLALAQLEKRGLAATVSEQTAFDCHLIHLDSGGAILSVDVASAEATGPFAALKPAGLLASARCYSYPEGVFVVVEEHGRLVLRASRGGTPLHTHIISAARHKMDQVAAELRIASLTLSQQNLINPVTGVELWGNFSPDEAASLRTSLSLPVTVKVRPPPDPALIKRLAGTGLLPVMGRAARRGQRLHSLKWVAAAALLASGLLWWTARHRALLALEDKAARMAETIDATAGSNSRDKAARDQVRSTQERWQGLRMALEPRRYPLIHLNHLSRCLGEGNVVLSRFESKGPELAVSGTAPSAMEAYSYYTTLTSDTGLRVYEWSMVQPVIAPNGMASFQIKGKMR